MSDPLQDNTRFKNLGIDASFIKNNANSQNDQLNKHYHGGSRQTSPTPVQTSAPRQSSQVSQTQPTNSRGDESMDMRQIEALMDKKITELASKMQQYADQTDKQIEKLQNALSELQRAVKSGSAQVSEQSEQAPTAPQQSAPTSRPAPPAQSKHQYNPADVAIGKIFDFSNNRTGKLK